MRIHPSVTILALPALALGLAACGSSTSQSPAANAPAAPAPQQASLVIHRKNGSNLTNWNIVPWNAQPGEIDLQGVLLHELGHCYWLDHASSGNEAMTGGYNYHSARFGPWDGDVQRAKSIYRDFEGNRLRELASFNSGVSWSPVSTQITTPLKVR